MHGTRLSVNRQTEQPRKRGAGDKKTPAPDNPGPTRMALDTLANNFGGRGLFAARWFAKGKLSSCARKSLALHRSWCRRTRTHAAPPPTYPMKPMGMPKGAGATILRNNFLPHDFPPQHDHRARTGRARAAGGGDGPRPSNVGPFAGHADACAAAWARVGSVPLPAVRRVMRHQTVDLGAGSGTVHCNRRASRPAGGRRRGPAHTQSAPAAPDYHQNANRRGGLGTGRASCCDRPDTSGMGGGAWWMVFSKAYSSVVEGEVQGIPCWESRTRWCMFSEKDWFEGMYEDGTCARSSWRRSLVMAGA